MSPKKIARLVRLQSLRKLRLANRLATLNANPGDHKTILYKDGFTLIASR